MRTGSGSLVACALVLCLPMIASGQEFRGNQEMQQLERQWQEQLEQSAQKAREASEKIERQIWFAKAGAITLWVFQLCALCILAGVLMVLLETLKQVKRQADEFVRLRRIMTPIQPPQHANRIVR